MHTDHDTLSSLMERYLGGDERALAGLYRHLAPRIRSRLSHMVSDRSRVDDLVQQTFVKAHQYREAFEWSTGEREAAVRRWYLMVARNVAIDDLRQRVRARRRLEQVERDGLTHLHLAYVGNAGIKDAEEALVEVQEQEAAEERVRRAVRELPPAQREIIELHKLGELSTVELADRLQVRPGTLRVRTHRACRRLAELLGAVPAAA